MASLGGIEHECERKTNQDSQQKHVTSCKRGKSKLGKVPQLSLWTSLAKRLSIKMFCITIKDETRFKSKGVKNVDPLMLPSILSLLY